MKQISFDKQRSTALKGIAIILMLFHHNFRETSVMREFAVLTFPFSQHFVVHAAIAAKICVSLFAFISGYGLLLAYRRKGERSDTRWICQREIKVLSGFWFVFAIALVFCQIVDGRAVERYCNHSRLYGLVQLFLDFMGMNSLFDTRTLNGTWWYMGAAVVFVLFIPLLAKLYDSFGVFPTLALCIIVPRLFGVKTQNGKTPLSFLFIVALGMLCAEYRLMDRWMNWARRTARMVRIKCAAETVILIGAIYVYDRLPNNHLWELKWGLIPLAVIFYSVEFLVDLPVLRRVLDVLGRHSMNIFFVHTFIRKVYYMNQLYACRYFLLIEAVLLGVSLLLSIAIEWMKKRIGYDKRIQTWMARVDEQITNWERTFVPIR